MATIDLNNSALGSQLQDLLMSEDIVPGEEPSYQIAKVIYLWHPMGAKMVEQPVKIAQSQQREISIPLAPEEVVRTQFLRTWKKIKADNLIAGTMYQAGIYGIGSIVYGARGVDTKTPIDPFDLPKHDLYFNILDPLNTAGSLVLNQDPNAPDFQKPSAITVAGVPYHPSRSCTIMNEQPVYIAYTATAFGFVGRSVYQRALFPLKTFIQSMLTDDMVTRKAGLLVAKMKPAGSIVNRMMQAAQAVKRNFLKEGQTGNVLEIGVDEDIETLNMQNTDTAMTTARKNVIENIATAAGMPAKLLLQESFAEGFGEGSEDAKHIVQYINRVREDMQPLYDYFDMIVQHLAWTPEFYATIQAQYPDEYGSKSYKQAFYEWVNSFSAIWPSLMEEPDSEKSKTEKVKLEGIIELLTVLLPNLPPDVKAQAIEWAQDNVNEQKLLFPTAMLLDIQSIAEYEPPELTQEDDAKTSETPARGSLSAVK